ncbi:lysis protein [Pseudomonas putida]|uniref:lysis protein n=1 Tax=Pseudomonas putida TaxID=303 RepID=UPI002364A624|nr:lysis protein [Pseudomonas putida]MDD1967116.1 lysis protein [Pseudomonas putida]
MTDLRIKLAAYGLAVLGLLAAGFAVAWFWQANAYGKVIATNESSRQADLTLIANAGADQARKALARQQDAEQRLAQLDKSATEEKVKANAENETLRRTVADGTRRLRIAGSWSAGGGNVPGTASAASVGDAGAVELSAATGRAVLDLRASIIADQAALKAAQAYIRTVCHSETPLIGP